MFIAGPRGRRLFAVWHAPAGPPRAAVVFCHPLLEEKKSAHRVMVDAARDFAARGFGVLRVDLAGCGDSEGDLRGASLAGWQDDIRAALRAARDRGPSVPAGLLGLRLGASLAARVAADEPLVRFLVLWEPVLDGRAHVLQALRKRQVQEMMATGRSTQTREAALQGDAATGDVEIDGHILSRGLIGELSALRPAEARLSCGGPVLIASLSVSERPPPALAALAAAFGKDKAAVVAVRQPPFWSQVGLAEAPGLADLTGKWLEQACPTPPAAAPGGPAAASGETGAVAAAAEPGRGPGEEPVQVESAGTPVRGILHAPAPSGKRRTGVILLHGWGGYRIGPHRLFVEAARRFAAEGYPCLRFDFRGRGESGGHAADASISSMADDVRAAIPAILRLAGVDRLVLAGICSGSKVAMAACRADESISGLVLWSAETLALGGADGRRLRRSLASLRSYARKMLRPATWLKILTFRVRAGMVRKAVAGEADGRREEAEDRRTAETFRLFRGPVLIIHGAADPETAAARTQLSGLCEGARTRADFRVIAGADHNFCPPHAAAALLEQTLDWLRAHP